MSAIHPLRKIIRILAAPAVAALFAASASPAQAQAKLIALWNFNDASITNKTTASPHGYTGALTAGAAFTADGGGHSGKAGDRAMDFGTNQTGQRVVVNGAGWLNPYTTNDQVTVSLWVRHYFTNLVAGSAFWMVSPSSTGSARGFQAHLPWDNDQVFFDSAGCCTTDETRIQGDISGFSGWTGDDSFWTNWHNFVFVKNAATKQIWIDGTLFLEGGGTTVLPGDFTQIVIGAASDGGGNLIGQIDDFAVFASALDATTIGKLAQGTAPASLDADTDGDGMPDWWEDAHGLNKNSAADASQDADNDGLTNLQEWVKGTDPKNADSDGDGLKDGVETGTGTFVSATNTGTDPNNWDSDGDTLSDGVETGTGKFVSASDTGSNPTKTDTDGDAYSDITEVTLGSNPVDSKITPVTAGKPNLLAFYDFNDASSVETTKDKVHGIVGRLDNGAAYTPDAGGHTGKAGDKAMDFGSDSNGRRVTITNTFFNAVAPNDKATVSLWVNLYEVANSSAIWADSPTAGRAFQAHLPWSDNHIYFDTGGNRVQDDTANFTNYTGDASFWNAWHHIALVKNTTVGQIWIDGQLFKEGGTPATLVTNVSVLLFGSAPGDNANMHGMLDDIAIYASALTKSQIQAIFSGTPPDNLDADADGDGMSDVFELAYGFNKNSAADAAQDADNDGLTNLQEFQKGTDPKNPDTDGDGIKDGAETGTGIYVSATDTGTDPTKVDSDGDGLPDNVETATGKYVSATNTGTDPNKADSDSDGYPDGLELSFKTDPNSAASSPAQPGALNLIAYWDFNDATDSTNTVDSVNGLVGQMLGGTVFTDDAGGHTGKVGDRAVDFYAGGNKSGQVIDVKSGFLGIAGVNDQITISLWQNLTEIANQSQFWGQSTDPATGGRGINIHLPWGDDTIYYDTDGCCGGTQRIAKNINTFPGWTDDSFWSQWRHYAILKDGPHKQVWIDGVLFFEGNNTGRLPVAYSDLFIGGSDADGGNSMHGMLDDFAVFAAALTPDEISQLAKGTAPNKLPARNVATKPKITSIKVNANGSLTIEWTGGGTLQSAPAVTGPWGDVTGATSPFTFTPTATQTTLFGRIKQ